LHVPVHATLGLDRLPQSPRERLGDAWIREELLGELPELLLPDIVQAPQDVRTLPAPPGGGV
jgi:hypothetical protein